jgi:hypothetical protein
VRFRLQSKGKLLLTTSLTKRFLLPVTIASKVFYKAVLVNLRELHGFNLEIVD